MARGLLGALVMGCLAAGPAAPTTRPATRPGAATRPAGAADAQPGRVRDALANGTVRFLAPADWELAKRADDGLTAFYKAPGGGGLITMVVTPQKVAFPTGNPALKQQLAAQIMKALTADLQKRNVDVIEPPRLERDEAFVAKVVYRFRDEGRELRALHVYRGLGFNAISVTASIAATDAAEAKSIQDAASMMLLSATAGPKDPKVMRPVPAKAE
jgi:hypothetical protein